MGDKSDDESRGSENGDVKNQSRCSPEGKSKDETKKMGNPVKNIETAKSSKPSDMSSSSASNITSLLSVAEKTIKDLYDTVSKKIANFVANDLQQLKNLSKDELSKLNASLHEYKNELEKLSQEKIKHIGDMKNKLHTRIITGEEVQSFVKYMDERISTIKKLSENMINTLRKNEAANTFVKDLHDVMTDYGKKMTTAMLDLYTALKEMAGHVGRSVIDKEKIATTMKKMPTSADLQKMPSILSKMFKKMGAGASSTKEGGETAKRVLLPVARFREKLPSFNLSKHFNSETMYGRANVAKATYAGVLLYFLYWKMKKSRS